MILFGMKRGVCILAAAAILGLQVFGSGGKEETIPTTIANAASIIGSLETKEPGTYTIVIEGESNDRDGNDFNGIAKNLRALPEGYLIHLDLAQARTRSIDFYLLNNIECLVTLILPTTLELLNYPEGPSLHNTPGLVEGCKNLSNIFIPAGFSDTYRNAEFLLRGINTCPNLKFTVASANQDFSTDKTGSMLLSKDGATLFAWIGASGSTTLPKTITRISPCAFEGNTSITKVKIHEGVTEIGGSAFSDCTALKEITLPASVTEIGWGTFSGCTALKEVTIPASVTEIGGSAFSGCTALKEITLPASVTRIGESAFSGCTGLTRVEFEDTNNWYLFDTGYFYISSTGKQINVDSAQMNAGDLTSGTGAWADGILAKSRSSSWEDRY